MKRNILLKQICDDLNLTFYGNNVAINGLYLAGRETSFNSVLAYATTSKLIVDLCELTPIKVVVARREDIDQLPMLYRNSVSWITTSEPEKTFYDIHDFLIDRTDFYEKYDFQPKIGQNAKIHPTALVENGTVIGDNVVIGPYTTIKAGTVLHNNVEISANTVIGDDGFQVLSVSGTNRKIRHCGGVVIGDNAYIGASSVVHRSLFEGATVIENDVKMDTKIYVAHNCFVGSGAVITSGCTLCGSVTVESGAWVGPNTSILNKVVIGHDSKIGMGSVVTRSIPPMRLAYGVPAKVKKEYIIN